MPGWLAVDPHCYQITDDVLFWRPSGEVLPGHAELVCSLLGQLIQRYGYALWLIDAERSIAVGHATRVVYGRYFTQECSRVAMASFHAPPAARTTALLTARGVQLRTAGELFHQPCVTEQEARSYLDQQRLLLKLAPPTLAQRM